MENTTPVPQAIDRMLDLLGGCLDGEAARRVANLEFDEPTLARIAELGEKANDGTITEEELSEYKACIDMADLVSALKLRAMRHLAAASVA